MGVELFDGEVVKLLRLDDGRVGVRIGSIVDFAIKRVSNVSRIEFIGGWQGGMLMGKRRQ